MLLVPSGYDYAHDHAEFRALMGQAVAKHSFVTDLGLSATPFAASSSGFHDVQYKVPFHL